MQIYKHVVHNVAAVYGQSATFMPKPIFGDNSSGMHVHQSPLKGSTFICRRDGYAGLSGTALFLQIIEMPLDIECPYQPDN